MTILYTSKVTGAEYDYCYTLEIINGMYANFGSYDEVQRFRKDYSCKGTLYTPDGYPVNETSLVTPS